MSFARWNAAKPFEKMSSVHRKMTSADRTPDTPGGADAGWQHAGNSAAVAAANGRYQRPRKTTLRDLGLVAGRARRGREHLLREIKEHGEQDAEEGGQAVIWVTSQRERELIE